MSETKRVIPVVIAHMALGCAVAFAYTFARPVDSGVIAAFVPAFRVRSALILFASWVPALQISSLLIGYALAFGKDSPEIIERWSAPLMGYLKGAFALCLVCISAYVILAEGFVPVLESRQGEAVARSDDYRDYLEVSRQAILDGDYGEAEFQSNVAVQIWPESPEATELHERAKYLLASASGAQASPPGSAKRADAPSVPGSERMTVLGAIDRANEAIAANDFYSAHYYSMIAYRLSAPTDPNRAVALRIASTAWNRLSEGFDSIEMDKDRALHDTKRRGYDAIQNGDYLSAYYIFLGLRDKEIAAGDVKIDPDVARFLDVARQGVLDAFFFIDETGNVKRFEASRDVFFVIKRKDGSTDAVFARGVSWKRSLGKDMAYLRDLEYARVGWDGKLAWRVAVPYAKMFAFADSDGTVKPELLLHAVDRNREGVETLPRVLAGSVSETERNIAVLDMPFADFSLIASATVGVSTMSLIDLFRFEGKAGTYGFSREAIRCETIARLVDPFLMLILSVYTLILGWRFRLGKNVLFKAWWVLALPLFPALSLYLMELARYVSRLVTVLIVRSVPQNPVLVVLGLLAIWFTATAFYFFSQRSD
jgi:hypothetical protein